MALNAIHTAGYTWARCLRVNLKVLKQMKVGIVVQLLNLGAG